MLAGGLLTLLAASLGLVEAPGAQAQTVPVLTPPAGGAPTEPPVVVVTLAPNPPAPAQGAPSGGLPPAPAATPQQVVPPAAAPTPTTARPPAATSVVPATSAPTATLAATATAVPAATPPTVLQATTPSPTSSEQSQASTGRGPLAALVAGGLVAVGLGTWGAWRWLRPRGR